MCNPPFLSRFACPFMRLISSKIARYSLKNRLVLGTLLYTNKKEQARDLYIQTSVYTNPCIFGVDP